MELSQTHIGGEELGVCSAQIREQIEAELGFFPPFFQPALSNPLVLENLWHQTVVAYVRNPLPARFKEKLNAYLSRFCAVPYCMVCHSCVLRPMGVEADDILSLLEATPPQDDEIAAHLIALRSYPQLSDTQRAWSDQFELHMLRCSIPLYTGGQSAHPYRQVLAQVLGPQLYQHLVAYIAYIKTCHAWMEANPDLSFLDDRRAQEHLRPLLEAQPQLGRFLQHYRVYVARERQRAAAAEATVAERALSASEIKAREARFEALVQATAQAVWSANSAGHVADLPWWSDLTGQSVEEMAGEGWLAMIHPDDRARAKAHWEQAFSACEQFEIDYRVQTRYGVYRHFLVRGVPIRDADQALYEWLGTFTDISEQKRAEHEREQLFLSEQAARRAAQEALQTRDAFLALASHELKNPLTTLLGHAELLQRRARRDGTFAEKDLRALTVISEQASRMTHLLKDLLDISQLEQGYLALNSQPVDVVALLREVGDEIGPTLAHHQLVWKTELASASVDGDPMRLRQIFHNLLDNAIKYSPTGGSVAVHIERDHSALHISVTDSGIGIPAAALPHLFQRFYRAANAAGSAISGSGIGLYVVREIARLHGGEIAVSSIEGEGSRFTVTLPLLADQTSDMKAA